MASRRPAEALASGIALVLLGGAGVAAFHFGLWGTLSSIGLMATWCVALNVRRASAGPSAIVQSTREEDVEAGLPLRLLLDQVPVPLVEIRSGTARVLNRAARELFDTEDQILPVPSALADERMAHMLQDGRRLRIDRVVTRAGSVAALIDIDAEERAGEERASADMIQVLGHEMLNGLAPIVSLAESGLATIDAPDREHLLPEILGTLARRAEGLLRFTEAYRTMARLPDPVHAPVALRIVAGDLAKLFAVHWGDRVSLHVDVDGDPVALLDRDQISQAVWPLLQNGAEAASSGDGDRHVSLTIRQRAGHVSIGVGDTGPGVAVEDRVRIFRPFHTTKREGLGVGLSLSRQIARAHGGDLVLTPGLPTFFSLSVPVTRTNIG